MDDLDLFREFCPDPGDPSPGHLVGIVRSLDGESSRRGEGRPGRRTVGAVGILAACVAVLIGVIIANRAGETNSPDTGALGAVAVRLDDHLAFVSNEGWDARRVTKQVPRSDGTSETADAVQIANFTLSPGSDADSAWSTIYPSLEGDQVVMTVRRVGADPPDAGSGVRVHQGLPVQLTEADLPSNLGGVVEVYVQVPFEYRGISYEIEIATDQNGHDALATVNRGLSRLRAAADEPGIVTAQVDGNVEYVVPSGWDARVTTSPSPPGGVALQTGNFPMPPAAESDTSGSSFMEALTGDEVYVNIFVMGTTPHHRPGMDGALRTGLPVRLRRSDFGGYEGMVQRTHARVVLDFRGTSYLIDVESQRDVAYTLAEANRALAGLRAVGPGSSRP